MDKVVKIYEKYKGLLRGHFLLSSGLHSDAYLQSERVMMHPEVAAEVVSGLVPELKAYEFSTVVSPAIGGIRFGYELARQLGKKTIFTERVDGEMAFRRGFELEKGEKVIVAEDVVTTGKSTKECIDAIIKNGGVVVAVATIIDRSNGKVEFGVPYVPLAKIDVKTWDVVNCPLCADGGVAVKPGSRQG